LNRNAALVRTVIRGVVAAALAAAPARAQQPAPDAGLYRLYQGTAELGRESFRRSTTALESSMTLPVLSLRMTCRTEFDSAGHVARFELRAYNLATDSLSVIYTAAASGDSLHFAQTRAGSPERRWARAGVVDAFSAPQTVAGLVALVGLLPMIRRRRA